MDASKKCRRTLRATLAASAAVAAVLAVPAAGSAATPIPQVSKPIPVTDASHPFGGAEFQLRPQQLKRDGYKETEHLVSGKANVYTWLEPGPAKVRTAGAPYTTRILVRRPKKAKDFSGNVIVEMLNPSNLFDLNIGWALAHDEIVRQRRRLGGHHRQADRRGRAQDVRSRALRQPVVRQSAA